MPRIVTATSLDKNEFTRGYQTTVFVVGMAHDFQVFSQLIGYSRTLYTPNNLSGKYFKLVETFHLIVIFFLDVSVQGGKVQ